MIDVDPTRPRVWAESRTLDESAPDGVGWLTLWFCEPPEPGVAFRVTRERFVDAHTVRCIDEWVRSTPGQVTS